MEHRGELPLHRIPFLRPQSGLSVHPRRAGPLRLGPLPGLAQPGPLRLRRPLRRQHRRRSGQKHPPLPVGHFRILPQHPLALRPVPPMGIPAADFGTRLSRLGGFRLQRNLPPGLPDDGRLFPLSPGQAAERPRGPRPSLKRPARHLSRLPKEDAPGIVFMGRGAIRP